MTDVNQVYKLISNNEGGKVYSSPNEIVKKPIKINIFKTNVEKKVDGKTTIVTEDRHNLCEDSLHEVVFLSQFAHPNIVTVKSIQSDKVSYIVTMEKGQMTLFDYCLSTPYEVRAKMLPFIMAQLASVLKFLHDNKITHGDIKPPNIIINKTTGVIKLIDFGAMCTFRPGRIFGKKCTYCFASLESFKKGYRVNSSLDMWSVGLTLAFLIFKKHCYNGKDLDKASAIEEHLEVIKGANRGKYPLSAFGSINSMQISENIQNLIEQMLVFDPNLRLTAHQLYNAPSLQQYIDKPTIGIFYEGSTVSKKYLDPTTNKNFKVSNPVLYRNELIDSMYVILKKYDALTSFCLAVKIMDRYSSLHTELTSEKYKMVAGCSIMISMSLIEDQSLQPRHISELANSTVNDVMVWSDHIIESLKYQVYSKTFDWELTLLNPGIPLNYGVIKTICKDVENLEHENDILISIYNSLIVPAKAVSVLPIPVPVKTNANINVPAIPVPVITKPDMKIDEKKSTNTSSSTIPKECELLQPPKKLALTAVSNPIISGNVGYSNNSRNNEPPKTRQDIIDQTRSKISQIPPLHKKYPLTPKRIRNGPQKNGVKLAPLNIPPKSTPITNKPL